MFVLTTGPSYSLLSTLNITLLGCSFSFPSLICLQNMTQLHYPSSNYDLNVLSMWIFGPSDSLSVTSAKFQRLSRLSWSFNFTNLNDTYSLILLYHISFISLLSKVATMLVVGQPITNDLSVGVVVSDTSSKHELDTQISQDTNPILQPKCRTGSVNSVNSIILTQRNGIIFLNNEQQKVKLL